MTPQQQTDFDPGALYQPTGPINPAFMLDAVRTLMRTLPLDSPTEPAEWSARRMHTALIALGATRPRNEIEVMLGVQAVAAYHAAATAWYLAMNSKLPKGDSTRHLTAAANAARTFDSLLKALERRQAKSLPPPQPRPEPRAWNNPQSTALMQAFKDRFIADTTPPGTDAGAQPVIFSTADLARHRKIQDLLRIEDENEGLDIANTEGILPGGGMIMPENPTPQQHAYLARRIGLLYKREYAENLRNGIKKYPTIRPIRAGDHIP